jgi:hypothetical protein
MVLVRGGVTPKSYDGCGTPKPDSLRETVALSKFFTLEPGRQNPTQN